MLARGYASFKFDAGLAHEYANAASAQYRGFVAQGTYRYGISDRATLELLAESIRQRTFASVGVEMYVSRAQRFTIRAGSGSERTASELRYELSAGDVKFSESLYASSEVTPAIFGFDDGRIAQLSEQSALEFPLGSDIFTTLQLSRYRSNGGSDSAALSARVRYRRGAFGVQLAPTYSVQRHALAASVLLDVRLPSGNRVAVGGAQSSFQTASSIRLRHDPTSLSDPLQASAFYASGWEQTRTVDARYEPSWITIDGSAERQNGKTIFEPQVAGALALVGRRVAALRSVDDRESFGILISPLSVPSRVYVNGSEIGAVAAHGKLVLRGLVPFRQNAVRLTAMDAGYDAPALATSFFVPTPWIPVEVDPTPSQ